MARQHAFLLGAEEYTEFDNIRFCHDDVPLLAETLEKKAGFREQDVTTVKLQPGDGVDPSDILNQLGVIGDRSQPGDTILFYFAGHGHLDKNDGEAYLILPDTEYGDIKRTALSLKDVSEAVRKDERLNVRIFDSCHSGKDVRTPDGEELDQAGFIRSLKEPEATGWITLAACQEDEAAHGDPNLSHGVYTYHLSQVIGDFPEGEPIRMETLGANIADRVIQWADDNSREQTPVLNLSVAGRPILGVRPTGGEEAVEEDGGAAPEEEPRDIGERLGRLRKKPPVGSDEHHEQLADAHGFLVEYFRESMQEVETHGLDLDLRPNEKAGSITGDAKRMIVRTVDDEDLQSCHQVEFNEWRETPPHAAFMGLTQFMQGQVKREYILSQKGDWPNSVVKVCVPSDGYIPGSLLFTYICPLQASVAIFYGYGFSPPNQGEGYCETGVSVWHRGIPLEDLPETMKEAVDFLWTEWEPDFEAQVRQRIEYVDRELDFG